MPFDTLTKCRDAVRSKTISSTELVRSTLDAIAKIDGEIGAYLEVFANESIERAKQVDAGQVVGPLAGVPIAIKDNLCTSWGKTTCASKMLADFRSPYDATVIEKLQAAGAILIGKTNLDEFAMGSSTENSAFQKTRNPWDTDRTPGGSSGGSAAAVAAGLCAAAIGSDTGGSIRQPASLCGLVGLKPTYGRVSRYGLVAFASSLDQIGPITRDVRDAAELMNVIAGHDPFDSTSLPDRATLDYLTDLDLPLKNLKIGIAAEHDSPGLNDEVRVAVAAAVEVYKSLGATVVNITLPHTDYGIAAYYVIAPCEASSNLARYDGVHFGHRTKEPVADIIELFSKSRAEGFGDEVQRRLMIGTYALSSGYYDAYYTRALKIRALIKQDFDRAFEQCDVILCPTSPIPAFKLGEKSGDPLALYLVDGYTVTANIAGIPAISLPCGFTTDAKPLPIGMQLMGRHLDESTLLRAARMYEAATDWTTRTAPV